MATIPDSRSDQDRKGVETGRVNRRTGKVRALVLGSNSTRVNIQVTHSKLTIMASQGPQRRNKNNRLAKKRCDVNPLKPGVWNILTVSSRGFGLDGLKPVAAQSNPEMSLQIGNFNPDGSIRAIAEDTVPQSLAVIDSHGPVRATLELQGGLTAKLNIRVGDTVKQRIFGNAP